jgi:citrate lyase subunit beta/citryl-CoA lyase
VTVVADPPVRTRGAAGNAGEDVRSDLRVDIEPGGSGLRIAVRSKVDALYGEQLREEVRTTLERVGVEDAAVNVEDRGALPWVVAARTEAAARAAGFSAAGDLSSPGDRGAREPSPRHRLRRSRLYLPGNEPKFMVSAGLHGPDAIILDLEDSVHPDRKVEARHLVRHALRSVDFGDAERMVRVNPCPLGLEDLAEVVPEGPDLILIPKAEEPDQVEEMAEVIAGIQARTAREASRPVMVPPQPGPTIWLMPILETARGIENAYAVACAHPTVAALTIGLEDYTADLGVARTPEGDESLWARRRMVNAARAAGVQAIDSVYGDVADEEGLLEWARRARAMGFEGMGCVHPRQIRIVHDGFAPSPAEIDKARRIVEAFREAEARGLGVVSLGSKMIDAPVVERARRLVRRAEAMGLLEGDGE